MKHLVLCLIGLMLWPLSAAAMLLQEDTVWSGQLSFSETVRVPEGVTLRINPKASIHFESGGIEVVAGTLIAEQASFSGDNWNGLTLKGVASSTKLTSCEISGAKTGIFVQGGAPQLIDLTLSGNKIGIEIKGKAAGRIAECCFDNNQKVGLFLKDDSSTSVIDSSFDGNGRFGAYIYRAKPKEFRRNVFSKNDIGLMVAYHGSTPLIEGNRFSHNRVGVKIDRAAQPLLRGNRIVRNQVGIYCYRRSDPQIAANLIDANETGVLVAYSSYPRINGNDFDGNTLALKLEFQSSLWEQQRGAAARASESAARSAFAAGDASKGAKDVGEEDRRATTLDGTVEARHNWWGKAETTELKRIGAAGNPSFIHDGRDQKLFEDAGERFPLDKVTHSPWSDRPVTEL
ncbi:MAG: right-handed parallel beta-helix repeat-containing protein [Desulfuromonadales bacterium]|nr:right-handed parallel beta-helix repeat-containing protein [Desulfuromonadales bacterium]